jgi:hypothetical protein
MGIYRQPNRWQCGPFALKHAFLVHGILVPESEISRIAGTNRYGTSESQLAKAARRFDCDLLMIRRLDPDKARRQLTVHLRKGIPCLLPIDDWSHWVTVVKEEKGRFILLDSEERAVLVIASWPELKNRWVYEEPDEYDDETVHSIFDLHPVVPRGRVRTKAKFSLELARYLRRKSNREFARLWDTYVNDLLAICRPRTALSKDVITLGEFFRRHEGMIVDQLDYWHGGVNPTAARKVLERMHLVADTYGLVIPKSDEKRTIAAISTILSLWAASEYGVDSIYRSEPKPKRRPRSKR